MDTAIFMPMAVFIVFVFGTWYALSLISNRNSQAEDRLERIGRPKSLTEIDLDSRKAGDERFAGLKETISNLGNTLEPQSDLEKSALKIKLANAGFRSESAPAASTSRSVLRTSTPCTWVPSVERR